MTRIWTLNPRRRKLLPARRRRLLSGSESIRVDPSQPAAHRLPWDRIRRAGLRACAIIHAAWRGASSSDSDKERRAARPSAATRRTVCLLRKAALRACGRTRWHIGRGCGRRSRRLGLQAAWAMTNSAAVSRLRGRVLALVSHELNPGSASCAFWERGAPAKWHNFVSNQISNVSDVNKQAVIA